MGPGRFCPRSALKMAPLALCIAQLCCDFNRDAQNGSEAPLKVLTLLRCVARMPHGAMPAVSLSSVRMGEPMGKTDQPTTIRKYENRPLFYTGTNTYAPPPRPPPPLKQ